MGIARLPVTTPQVLREHVQRHRAIERSGSIWIYVGTIGLDGVDDLISPDSPPFQNNWTNSLGDDSPVSFTIINGWVHIRGAFTGGADNTVVFTLPVGYRPEYQQQVVIPTGTLANFATAMISANGDVMFGTVV